MVILDVAAAPIIVALVSVVGGIAPGLPRRVYPAVAVGLGVLWQCAVASVAGEALAMAALSGVLTGLAACGLYSATLASGRR